jgi:plasmid maintenance system antidote protein VapI
MNNRQRTDFKITDEVEMLVTQQPPLTAHPGVFVRTVLLPGHGLTNVVKLAELLRVARPNLANVLNGKRPLTREMAYRFGALLGREVGDFLVSYVNAWDVQEEQGRRDELSREIELWKAPEPAS